MAGFSNDTIYGGNVDFTGGNPKTPQMVANGQLLIGSAIAPFIRAGLLTSIDTSVTFTVGNGTIDMSVSGGTTAVKTITGTSGGALLPTAGNITFHAATVAAGTTPAAFAGAVSTETLNLQISQAIAATDATKIGLANFDSASFSVDANGFVTALGTGIIKTITGTSGGALSPTAGNITFHAATVAAGTTPAAFAGAVSTETLNLQISQAIAATDATKIGLANFNSADFIVDANGFVSLVTSVALTFTGDSGAGPAVPAAGNLNIVGLAGCQTSTAGSTVTIKAPLFLQVGASSTSAKNTGEFVTAAVTRTLPASAGLIDGDLFIYVCTTAGALVIQTVTAQKIRMGTLISSAAGTATSTQIGDSITLRFNATDGFFYAVAWAGTWLIA